jgi:hypothetical protein
MAAKRGDRREFLQGVLAAGGAAAAVGSAVEAQQAPGDAAVLPA